MHHSKPALQPFSHPPRLPSPSRQLFSSFFSGRCLWITDDTSTRLGSFAETSTDPPGIVTRLARPRVAPPLLKTKISSSSAPLWPRLAEETLEIVRPYWLRPCAHASLRRKRSGFYGIKSRPGWMDRLWVILLLIRESDASGLSILLAIEMSREVCT